MRFLHAADLHLDSPLAGLRARGDERAEEIATASRRAFNNLVAHALNERIDLVLLAGDVFDGNWHDYNSGLFFVAGLAKLNQAGIPVVMIRGNHDAASVMSRKLGWPPNVRELCFRSPETVRFEALNVAVHGQSFPQRAVPENLVHKYPEPVTGWLNIGLLHTSADGRPGHDSYAPCALHEMRAKGYDYWALGHVHQREVLSTDPYVVFPGNLQGRHVNEPGAKGFTVVTTQGGRVAEVEHVAADEVRWARVKVDATGATSLAELIPRIGRAVADAATEAEGRTLAVRIVLKGACAVHRALAGDPARLEAECASLAMQAPGDVWIERIDVRTSIEEVEDESGVPREVIDLLRGVRLDEADGEAIRETLRKGLAKIGSMVVKDAGMGLLAEERFAGLLEHAEASVLHHLAGEPGA